MKKEYLELLGSDGIIRYLVGEDVKVIQGTIHCILGFDPEHKMMVIQTSNDIVCMNVNLLIDIRIKEPKWLTEQNPSGELYG